MAIRKLDVRDWSGRVAVVTGAASGIGRETALELARRGADLALCDLDEAGLKRTGSEIEGMGRRSLCVRVDVANAGEMESFANAVFAALERVDIVVNNAGIGVGGLFLDVPLEEWDTIFGVNLKGVVHGCYFFLPRMIEAGRGGHIVNIASLAGLIQTPGMTAYSTTKFGVVGFSETLRAELADLGIGVTVICPGIINTPIIQTSRMYGANATDENRQRGVDLYARRAYGPDRVARQILKAVGRNRGVAPVSPESWVGYWVKRAFPWAIAALGRAMVRRQIREAGS